MARAGMPIRAASANRSFTRAAPSSIEYSVWTCRWVKLSGTSPPRSVHRLWVMFPQGVDKLHGCNPAAGYPGPDPVGNGVRIAESLVAQGVQREAAGQKFSWR